MIFLCLIYLGQHKKIFITLTLVVIILVPVLYVAKNSLHLWGSRDLGPRLKYIGKSDYGCILVVVCVGPVGSVYYFATDMTQEELGEYFKKATIVELASPGGGGSGEGYNFNELLYRPRDVDDTFPIDYYDNTPAVIKAHNLTDTGKPYIISIGDSDYELARSSL